MRLREACGARTDSRAPPAERAGRSSVPALQPMSVDDRGGLVFSGSRYRLIGLVAAAAAAVVLGTAPNATPAAASGGCGQDQIYVSPDGNDHNSGTKAKPFKTVRHARDAVRQRGLNKAGKMRC